MTSLPRYAGALAIAAALAGWAGPPARAADPAVDLAALTAQLRTASVVADPAVRGLRAGDVPALARRVARRAPGRLRVLVLPAGTERGSLREVANDVDTGLGGVPGALLVAAGRDEAWVVTSYAASDAAAAAVRAAGARPGLRGFLVAAVDGLASVDPGPAGDPVLAPPVDVDVDGFLDEVAGAFRLGVLGVLALLAVVVVAVLALVVGRPLVRARRARARADATLEWRHDAARASLVTLGERVLALDLDDAMPGADPAGREAYAAAVAAYTAAEDALRGDADPDRTAAAERALSAGLAAVARAAGRLGGRAADAVT